MEQLQRDLLMVLTHKPKTRAELCQELGVKDRALRKAVAGLRRNGYNVSTNSETGGYWLGNEKEKRRLISELRTRAYDELDTANKLERGPIEGQVSI